MTTTAWVETLESRQMLDGSGLIAPLPTVAAPAVYGTLEAMKQAMIERAVADWGWALGTTIPNDGGDTGMGAGPIAMNSAAPAPKFAANTTGAASAAPRTALAPAPNAAQGGDIVATDGRTLYLLTGQKLKIIDARDPSGLSVLAAVDLKAAPIAEYLNGTTLTVISQENGWDAAASTRGAADPAAVKMAGPSRSMMMPWSYNPRVNVAEFDVANPAQPRLLRQTTLDGSYIQSRSDGARVDLVLSPNLPSLPGPELSPAGPNGQVYETEPAYRARLQQVDISALLPTYTSTVRNAAGVDTTTTAPLLSAQNLYKPATGDDYGLLSVVSLDTSRAGNAVTGTIGITAGGPSTTLFDGDSLWLAGTTYVADLADQPNSGGEATVLRKIDLSGPQPVYAAAGVVPGAAVNGSALDAQAGRLRIATTVHHWTEAGDASVNNVYVLQANGAALSTVGKLEGLAPGAALSAARFVGDHAYLSSSASNGALTVIDFSNPAMPKASGTLALSGAFTTLQAIDATRIVAIGRAVEPGGGFSQDLKIVVMYSADPDHPRIADVETVSGDWAWSPAEYDPQTLFFDPATGTLAIPVSTATAAGPDGQMTATNGLDIFRLSATAGLTPLGRTTQDSPVTRAVAIGGVLYSIATDTLQASPLTAPGQTLDTLVIQTPSEKARGIGGPMYAYTLDSAAGKRPRSALPGGPGAVRSHRPRPTLPVIQTPRRGNRGKPVIKQPVALPKPIAPRLAFIAGRLRHLGGLGSRFGGRGRSV